MVSVIVSSNNPAPQTSSRLPGEYSLTKDATPRKNKLLLVDDSSDLDSPPRNNKPLLQRNELDVSCERRRRKNNNFSIVDESLVDEKRLEYKLTESTNGSKKDNSFPQRDHLVNGGTVFRKSSSKKENRTREIKTTTEFRSKDTDRRSDSSNISRGRNPVEESVSIRCRQNEEILTPTNTTAKIIIIGDTARGSSLKAISTPMKTTKKIGPEEDRASMSSSSNSRLTRSLVEESISMKISRKELRRGSEEDLALDNTNTTASSEDTARRSSSRHSSRRRKPVEESVSVKISSEELCRRSEENLSRDKKNTKTSAGDSASRCSSNNSSRRRNPVEASVSTKCLQTRNIHEDSANSSSSINSSLRGRPVEKPVSVRCRWDEENVIPTITTTNIIIIEDTAGGSSLNNSKRTPRTVKESDSAKLLSKERCRQNEENLASTKTNTKICAGRSSSRSASRGKSSRTTRSVQESESARSLHNRRLCRRNEESITPIRTTPNVSVRATRKSPISNSCSTTKPIIISESTIGRSSSRSVRRSKSGRTTRSLQEPCSTTKPIIESESAKYLDKEMCLNEEKLNSIKIASKNDFRALRRPSLTNSSQTTRSFEESSNRATRRPSLSDSSPMAKLAKEVTEKEHQLINPILQVQRFRRGSKSSDSHDEIKLEAGNEKTDCNNLERDSEDRVKSQDIRIPNKKDMDVVDLLSSIKERYEIINKNGSDENEHIKNEEALTPRTEQRVHKMFRKFCKGRKQVSNESNEQKLGSSPAAYAA